MPKEIITADEAAQAGAPTEPITPATDPNEGESQDDKPKRGRPPKKSEPESVTFRTSNIGRIFLPDNSPFDFVKPLMTVSDPKLIIALTELAGRKPTNISIHQP